MDCLIHIEEKMNEDPNYFKQKQSRFIFSKKSIYLLYNGSITKARIFVNNTFISRYDVQDHRGRLFNKTNV